MFNNKKKVTIECNYDEHNVIYKFVNVSVDYEYIFESTRLDSTRLKIYELLLASNSTRTKKNTHILASNSTRTKKNIYILASNSTRTKTNIYILASNSTRSKTNTYILASNSTVHFSITRNTYSY